MTVALPAKIRGFRSRPINELIDVARSLTPISSATIKHTMTPQGVISNVMSGPASIVTEDLHFRVEHVGKATCRIHGGRWSRTSHGVETIITPTVDSGTAAEYSGVKSITVTAATGYAIATLDNAYVPTELTLSYTTTAPGGTDPTRLVKYLAKITATLSGGAYYVSAIEPMHMGDIKDSLDEPDAYLGAAGTGYSLAHNATSKTWELNAFAAGTDGFTLGANDRVGVRIASGTTSKPTLQWSGLTNFAAWVAGALTWDDLGEGTPLWWDTWARANHSHNQHLNFTTDDHVRATNYGYMLLNDIGTPAQSATRNTCDADMRIGDAAGAASINPAGRIIYDTDGTTTVMNWNAAGGTAWELTWNATNKWTPATLLAAPSGAITLDASAGGALTLKAKNASTWTFSNKLDMGITSASAWTFGDNLTVAPTTDEAGTMSMGSGSYRWAYLLGYASESIALASASISLNAAQILYGSGLTAGITITGFSTAGGVTGGSRKQFKNLDPDDYVVITS